MEFPIVKTKVEGLNKKFNLIDPQETKEYFLAKCGSEIKRLRRFLNERTFIAYLLGKKNSGKGTYSKMFAEIISPEKIDHFSIGDMVRTIDKELVDETKKKELIEYLKRNYRGYLSLEEIIKTLENRSTKTLLPTELILVLVKREIEKREKKSIFVDGFPRDLDQINFSLFFRDLIGYRDDPDIFILIDVPEMVINERIKWRRVCPVCNTSRNLKLLPTSQIGYNKEKNEFYLICEKCGVKMEEKEGDALGIEPLRERLKKEEELMKKAFLLHGIPKILLRNSIPVEIAKEYVDDYEITPVYEYEWLETEKKVKVKEKPWVIKDDQGKESYSLLAPPVVVSLIKQLVEIFNLT